MALKDENGVQTCKKCSENCLTCKFNLNLNPPAEVCF